MYGFHDVYANRAALPALRSGGQPAAHPDGAQFGVSIDPSGKPIDIDAATCHACHAQASGGVFTRYRE